VFAIPGNINNDYAKGPHQMIRDGATLVEHPQDILDVYRDVVDARQQEEREKQQGQLDPEENELGLIREPRTLEELMLITGKNVIELTQALNQAVIMGRAKRLPGSQYALP
jgi:DNA processing protein